MYGILVRGAGTTRGKASRAYGCVNSQTPACVQLTAPVTLRVCTRQGQATQQLSNLEPSYYLNVPKSDE
jgi:hypothetical protein